MTDVTVYPITLAAANQIAEQYGFDDVIPHDEIDGLLEISRPADEMGFQRYERYKLERISLVGALKDFLLKQHLILLRSVQGVGYRLVHPSDQTGVAVCDLQAGMRKHIKRGKDALTYIRRDMLTDYQAQQHLAAQGQMVHMAQTLKREQRLLNQTVLNPEPSTDD